MTFEERVSLLAIDPAFQGDAIRAMDKLEQVEKELKIAKHETIAVSICLLVSLIILLLA